MLKIKEVREGKNLSQDEVVELTGIAKRSYVNYENGKTDIPFSKLQNIAKALNVPIQGLVDEEGSKQAQSGKKNKIEGSFDDTIISVRNEIRSDLKIILDGMTANFEVINEGILQGLKDQQKVLKFIEKMDQAKVFETAGALREYLKQHK